VTAKEDVVAAMRAQLEDFYTRRPSSAMGNVPLGELADAAMAALAKVGLDKIPAIPVWDNEVSPKLRWNEAAGVERPAAGIGVTERDGEVILMPYEGDYTHPDGEIPLKPTDAQAFAVTVLAAVQKTANTV
jgi:hypothetical protein